MARGHAIYIDMSAHSRTYTRIDGIKLLPHECDSDGRRSSLPFVHVDIHVREKVRVWRARNKTGVLLVIAKRAEGTLCTRIPVTLCWSVRGFGCAKEAGAVEGFGGGARRVPRSLTCGMTLCNEVL